MYNTLGNEGLRVDESVQLTKSDGRKVLFDFDKIISTCIRAGASRNLAQEIAQKVFEQSYDGMTTKEVYKKILRFLKDQHYPKIQNRYRLRESIMSLGPTGFIFESFVGQILEKHGYRIESIRSKVKGQCVEHEIDLIARSSKNNRYMIECKYHNIAGIFTGLKETLYTHARFLDLKEEFDREMLVSNTQISGDAIQYAKCVGQDVLSWRYPKDNGLEKMIEDQGLYPVTLLHLSKNELDAFSKINFLLARNLLNVNLDELSKKTGISTNRLTTLQSKINQIL